MGMTRRRWLVAALASVFFTVIPVTILADGAAAERYISIASTTSTENSGLFGYLQPIFKHKTGIDFRVVALGTGQALDVGRRGDVDVVFVHDKAAEERFVAEGFGIDRRDVMYNDFVLVGPKSDPARIASGHDIAAALRAIKTAQAPFVSRGDRSGTHAAELRLWTEAGIDITASKDTWYRETGSGMGAALNTASSMNAYILSDRGTWLAFRNRGELTILIEGDKRLFNQYGVIMVNPARHPQVKHIEAQAFIDWLTSADGQATIAAFRINGQQAFFPDAHKQ